MKLIETYQGRKTYWLNYSQFDIEKLPSSDWVFLAVANEKPTEKKFKTIVERCIQKNISEFKGQGLYGTKLHDLFDETMVDIELNENIKPFEIMTTAHEDETFADVLWQCYFATCLPGETNFDNISIVCTDLNGSNRSTEIKNLLEKFNQGWTP